MAVPVAAEWALWGKDLGRGGYRVLECSTGLLSEENFAELISRYSPGPLPKLPQVTISWIPGPELYLAIAFHDAPGWRDDDGREVRPIRYFCMPFRELSAGIVSYQAMYEGFYGVVLRNEDGSAVPNDKDRSLIQTELNEQPPEPPPDRLAVRVAALLLTGTPVRIVGAEDTELSERLRFLDDVASLLPYGMRSQLSCATWVSSTSPEHRFRLFFSHQGDKPHVPEVSWGDNFPNLTGDPVADDYADWLLEDVPERVELLAGLTRPMDIGSPDDIHRFLEMLGRDFGRTAQVTAPVPYEQQNLRKIVRKLATFDALIPRLNLDARLEGEVRNVLAATDEALQRESSRHGFRTGGIRSQRETAGQLAELASYASRLVEKVQAALLAQYEERLRELRKAENRLAALNALVREEGPGAEPGRDAAILSAETERAINASDELRDLLAQPDPDLAALEAVMLRPSALAARTQQMTGRLSGELRRFSVSLHYPKLLCAGFSSSFLVQIYPPHRQQAVSARVKDVFGDPVPAEVTRKARFQVGMKVRIRLSSPVMEFSDPVGKVISSTDTHTTFQGMPKPSTFPGVHAAVLAVSDERGEEELLSMPFEVNIVDYAFDHVSRPFAGRVTGGIVGVASVCVLALAFITRTAQVLDAAGGAVGLALSAFFFTRVETVFRRRAVTVEGTAQSPPPR